MATTIDARALAGPLVEALLSAAAGQISAVAPRLAGLSASEAAAALPADMPPQVRNFLLMLAKEGLASELPAVVGALQSYVGATSRPIDASVTSAVELSGEQQAAVAADLRQRYGELSLSYAVDPSLIGGLIIRVGDQVLDNSLRARLSAVQRSMQVS